MEKRKGKQQKLPFKTIFYKLKDKALVIKRGPDYRNLQTQVPEVK